MNTAHLEYETLADLAEGLLDTEPAAAATAHLEQCAECRDRSAELTEVSRLLAEVPVPPMPAELAGRIDAALAAEAAATSNVPSLEARRGRRRMRILSAAAAAIVVAGGGTVVARTAMQSPITSDASKAQSPAQERSERSTAGGSGAGVSPNAAPEPRQAAADQFTVATSGTDYHRSTLGSQVTAELLRPGHTMSRPPGVSTRQLTDCVRRIAANRRPLLVDLAGYEGSPATVIALPGGGANRLDVWVVGPGCSATTSDVIEHVQTTRG